MKIVVDYPDRAEEIEIVQRMSVNPPHAARVLSLEELRRLQAAVDEVFAHRAVIDYAVRLVHATRVPAEHGLADITGLIEYGASPRASLGLIAAARAFALLRGREYVLPQDVSDCVPEILRHRVVLSYEALADGVSVDDLLAQIVATVPAPRLAPSQDPTSIPAPPTPLPDQPAAAQGLA
jgi:MoxR-like ATPase